jgi:hypothetical protein
MLPLPIGSRSLPPPCLHLRGTFKERFVSTNDTKPRAVGCADAPPAGPASDHPKGPLTDSKRRTVRPGKARYDLPDRDGLVLRVGTKGSMTWRQARRPLVAHA